MSNPAYEALTLPLVLLAGFAEEQASAIGALLSGHCQVATTRTPHDPVVLCLGPRLSPIEARHRIAATGESTLVLLTAAGSEPAMFQDLIDADRLFYLSPGEPPPSDLAALIRAALEHRHGTSHNAPAPPGLLPALNAARRIAAQPDLASAGDLLQLAAEECIEADRVYCLFYDAAAEVLWSRTPGLTHEERQESPAVGLVSFVARTGRAVSVAHASQDPRFEHDADDPLGTHCEHLLAVPVRPLWCAHGGDHHGDTEAQRGKEKDWTLAVLCVVRDAGRVAFSATDEAALAQLASTVAPALAQLAMAARLEVRRDGDTVFREEAIQYHAAGDAHEGDWLRLSPRWTTATFWLLIALVAAFLLFAAVGTIGERSIGPAVVRLTGRTEVSAAQAGLVTAVEVSPHQRVEAGAVLVRFQDVREAAELARIEQQWELQLIERLRDLSATPPAQALIALRGERELARARLDERVVRAPRAGIVGDVRCRPDQHVDAGDILLSLGGDDARPVLMALLPGEHRPLLKPGMPLDLRLRGYRQAPQHLTITAVSDEIIGADEAKRLLGPEAAGAVPLNGAFVRVNATFPAETFAVGGERYALHDGMWGAAEVPVRSESLLTALVPGLRAALERIHE